MAVMDDVPAHLLRQPGYESSVERIIPQWVRVQVFAEDAKQYTAVRLTTGDHHSQYQHILLIPPGPSIEELGAQFRSIFPFRCVNCNYDDDLDSECEGCWTAQNTVAAPLTQHNIEQDEHGYFHTPFADWLVKYKGGIRVPKAETYAISAGG